MSLSVQREIHLTNCCGAIYDEELLIKAMLWYANGNLQISKKKVYKHAGYATVTICREKVKVHRLIGMFVRNIRHVSEEYHFHHINGNKLDDRVENIVLINRREHFSLHNKGRKVTSKMMRRLIEYNHQRKGKFLREDVSPYDVYNLVKQGMSLTAISRKFHLNWTNVKKRYEFAKSKFDRKEGEK